MASICETASVRCRSQLEAGAHFCCSQIVSSKLASGGNVGGRAIAETEGRQPSDGEACNGVSAVLVGHCRSRGVAVRDAVLRFGIVGRKQRSLPAAGRAIARPELVSALERGHVSRKQKVAACGE